MKQYKYIQSNQLLGYNNFGEKFYMHKDETITTCDGKTYLYEDNEFTMSKERLKELFQRVYTVEEQNRYDRIYENAMIAAMQSQISNLKDVEISADMHEVEYVPINAIWYANRLVEELKEKEF